MAACTVIAARDNSIFGLQNGRLYAQSTSTLAGRSSSSVAKTPRAFVGAPYSSTRDNNKNAGVQSSQQRPYTIVSALPNQFGHDRFSSQRRCYSSIIGSISQTSAGARRTGNTNMNTCPRSSRCTKLFATQDIEENIDIVELSKTSESDDSAYYLVDASVNAITRETETDSNLLTSEIAIAVDDEESTTTLLGMPKEFLPILSLCILVTLLSALDRVAMSIAILPISTEFHYSETIKGQISSAVSYGYGLAILPIGLAVSVVSSRTLMLVGVFLWSLATLGTPWMAALSNSGGSGTEVFLLPLLLIRAVMGAAEAVVLPTMQRVLATWVPPEKKATALAIVISGFQLGTVSAYLVSPLILDFMSGLDGGPADIPGWRGMFYVYGMAGLLWMIPWSIVAKDAPTSNNNGLPDPVDCEETLVNNMLEDDASLVLNECAIEYTDKSQTSRIQEMKDLLQSAPWSDFLTSKGVLAMTLAHAAKNFELYNILAWTPTFFSEQYGLNVKESAIYSILPSVCGMIGGVTAGNAADFVLLKVLGDEEKDSEAAIEKRTQVRKLFQTIALLGPATCLYLLSSLPEQASTAQVLLGGAVGLQAFDAAGFGAATQEKAGQRWAGLLYSLTSLPGVMIGSVSVSITGQLLDLNAGQEGAGWAAIYQLNAAVCVVGAVCFLALYDSKKEFE